MYSLNRAVFNWVSKVFSRLLWFNFTTLRDWLTKFSPLSQPMRSKTNRASLTRVFPRLAPVACICFEFWLVHCLVYTFCDWSEKLLWVWFYDTGLKTVLSMVLCLLIPISSYCPVSEDVVIMWCLVFIQLAPDQGVQSMDPSTGVKRRCDEEAEKVVQENNVGRYVICIANYV